MKKYRLTLAVVLAAALLLQSLITAAAEGTPACAIRSDEIQSLFDTYVSEHDLNPELISVAYVYTETNETWYHLPDTWYYSASLYKVPLMMILAERESDGELERDSLINGMQLSEIEEEVLINSNNDIAYSTMLYIDQPSECRAMFQRYSPLKKDYYDWNFYSYSYFTARFMADVLCTLYRQEDRFPRLIEYMKQAQPDHYFRLSVDSCDVAQKYGCYHDEDGTDWNHTAGIIYTPVPFILVVMTRYGGISENIIADIAEMLLDYTISVTETNQNTQLTPPLSTADAGETDGKKTERITTEKQQTEAEQEYNSRDEDSSDPHSIFEQETESDHNEDREREPEEEKASRKILLVGCAVITLLMSVFTVVTKKRNQ